MKTFVMVLVLGALLAPCWAWAAAPAPVVTGVRVFRLGDSLGVEVSADQPVEFASSKMPGLLKVIIDLPGTNPGTFERAYRYKSALVTSVRLERKTLNGVPVTRVSINLAEDADFTAQSVDDDRKVRVMLRKPASGSSVVPAAGVPLQAGAKGENGIGGSATPISAPPKAAAPETAAPKAAAPQAAAGSVAAGGNQPVTVSAIRSRAEGIEIETGSRLEKFTAFTMQKPGRLVIDISGAHSKLTSLALPANPLGVSKARVGRSQGNLRLVLEVNGPTFPKYELQKTDTGLRVIPKAAAQTKK